MELIIHVLEHSLSDTWLMLPLLFITYIFLEFFDRKETNSDEKIFFGLQKYGPLVGAVVGLIPQCGFSILAAMLYVQRNITMGTLIAVMIATSDEAIPILLSNPELYSTLGLLIVLKFIIAVAVGYFTDKALFKKQKIVYFDDMEEEDDEEYEEEAGSSCPCCYPQYPIPVSALLRALRIYAFIFVTSVVLTLCIEIIGEETLGTILLSKSIFQPVLASIFGFIPNCAITVVLAQLFAAGELQFGSLLAGLITNAGLGLVVLIRYGERKKNIFRIVTVLFVTASLCGMILTFMGV